MLALSTQSVSGRIACPFGAGPGAPAAVVAGMNAAAGCFSCLPGWASAIPTCRTVTVCRAVRPFSNLPIALTHQR
jgi:hypothetical protein